MGTVAVLAGPIAHVLRQLGEDERRRATWLLAGSILSLAPVLSVEASQRLLAVATIGVSAIVGLVLDRAWFPSVPPAPGPRRGMAELVGLVALWLGFAHFVRAPLDTWIVMRNGIRLAQTYVERVAWAREHIDTSRSTVVVVRADSPETILWAPFMLGDVAPLHWRVLSFASGRSLLLRTGPRTLELISSDRPLFHVSPDDLFRSTNELKVGDSVALPGMRATVLQLDDKQMPRRLRYEFDSDLEKASISGSRKGRRGSARRSCRRWGTGCRCCRDGELRFGDRSIERIGRGGAGRASPPGHGGRTT